MRLMFDNPAASSAAIDFIIANVLLLPLIAIVDGRRRGINKPWLYFVVTLFASFSFGWAFYARHGRAPASAGPEVDERHPTAMSEAGPEARA